MQDMAIIPLAKVYFLVKLILLLLPSAMEATCMCTEDCVYFKGGSKINEAETTFCKEGTFDGKAYYKKTSGNIYLFYSAGDLTWNIGTGGRDNLKAKVWDSACDPTGINTTWAICPTNCASNAGTAAWRNDTTIKISCKELGSSISVRNVAFGVLAAGSTITIAIILCTCKRCRGRDITKTSET